MFLTAAGGLAWATLPLVLTACDDGRSGTPAAPQAPVPATSRTVRTPSDFVERRHSSEPISIWVPKDWTHVESNFKEQNDEVMRLRTPRGGRELQLVQIMKHELPAGVSFEDFVEGLAYWEKKRGRPVPRQSHSDSIAGLAAHRWTGTESINGIPFNMISYAIVRGQSVYMVGFAALADGFDRHEDLAEQIIRSFKIEPSK